jgi:hypothetical protein
MTTPNPTPLIVGVIFFINFVIDQTNQTNGKEQKRGTF